MTGKNIFQNWMLKTNEVNKKGVKMEEKIKTGNLPKLCWMLIDGLSYDMVQEFVHKYPDTLKWFAKNVQQKSVFPLKPLFPNCQTPPSLFSIWSGLPIQEHKIYGYDNPSLNSGEENITQYVNGFNDFQNRGSLVWDYYLQNNKKVKLYSIPFVNRTGNKNMLAHINVYNNKNISPFSINENESLFIEQVAIKISFKSEETKLTVKIEGAGNKTEKGINKQEISQWHSLKIKTLTGGHKSESEEELLFKIIKKENQHTLVCMGLTVLDIHGTEKTDLKKTFQLNKKNVQALCSLYRKGTLGKRLHEGGNGEAENILLDSICFAHHKITNEILLSLQKSNFDLFVGYYPFIDLLSHEILGIPIKKDGSINLKLQEKTDEIYITTLSLLDQLMQQIENRLPPDYKLIVNSDHGMQPVKFEIFPNTILKNQNWLKLNSKGEINPQESLCFLHPAENGLMIFNKKIMVNLKIDEKTVFEAINAELNKSGNIKMEFIKHELDVNSKKFSARYFLKPPVYGRAKATIHHELIRPSRKNGDHTTYSDSSELRGVLISPQNSSEKMDNLTLTDLLEIALS